MRNFIKNHTPEWWDGWCWFGLATFCYSVFWVAFGSMAWTRGFQAGMAFYWVGFLTVRSIAWYDRDLLRIYRELNELNNKIMLRQRETIALKNETIAVLREHVNYLKGQR